MYVPPSFREERQPVLHGFMRESNFAPMVTTSESGLEATHLPWLVDAAEGPLGRLRGHVARANSHWQRLGRSTEALVIFGGPHAYISPSWYPAMAEHGRVVPTWNYITVHVRGRVRAVDDQDWLRGLVGELTAKHEAARPKPWVVEDAPADYVAQMLAAIVGIEVAITAIDGKWKLGQNRSRADREGMAAGLAGEGEPGAEELARVIGAGLRG